MVRMPEEMCGESAKKRGKEQKGRKAIQHNPKAFQKPESRAEKTVRGTNGDFEPFFSDYPGLHGFDSPTVILPLPLLFFCPFLFHLL